MSLIITFKFEHTVSLYDATALNTALKSRRRWVYLFRDPGCFAIIVRMI